jgi:hypothetical protein
MVGLAACAINVFWVGKILINSWVLPSHAQSPYACGMIEDADQLTIDAATENSDDDDTLLTHTRPKCDPDADLRRQARMLYFQGGGFRLSPGTSISSAAQCKAGATATSGMMRLSLKKSNRR